jgi:hypothetical protein
LKEVQVGSETTSATAILDDLKAILEVSEILASVLSEEEIEQFSGSLWAQPSSPECLSCGKDSSSLPQYVPTSVLDADHGEIDHKEDDL